MKILFIGGTKFVGRNIAELALAQGHEVHLLQRGKTNKDIFEQVTKYIGDRQHIEDLIPHNQLFDLVIDTCGYHPGVVEKSVRFLKNKTQKYIFISTCSVYADFSQAGLNEESAVQTAETIPDINVTITGENYGLLKAKCEDVIRDNFDPNRFLILRPGIIVGKYDDTNRFNFILSKIKKSTSFEIPDSPEPSIQFIDIRALSEFVLNRHSLSGVYNLVGPKDPITFLEFIHLTTAIINPSLELNYVSAPKDPLPLYLSDDKIKGLFAINGSKAYLAGLRTYSAEETVKYVARDLGFL